jgi:hypothetical protein
MSEVLFFFPSWCTQIEYSSIDQYVNSKILEFKIESRGVPTLCFVPADDSEVAYKGIYNDVQSQETISEYLKRFQIHKIPCVAIVKDDKLKSLNSLETEDSQANEFNVSQLLTQAIEAFNEFQVKLALHRFDPLSLDIVVCSFFKTVSQRFFVPLVFLFQSHTVSDRFYAVILVTNKHCSTQLASCTCSTTLPSQWTSPCGCYC